MNCQHEVVIVPRRFSFIPQEVKNGQNHFLSLLSQPNILIISATYMWLWLIRCQKPHVCLIGMFSIQFQPKQIISDILFYVYNVNNLCKQIKQNKIYNSQCPAGVSGYMYNVVITTQDPSKLFIFAIVFIFSIQLMPLQIIRCVLCLEMEKCRISGRGCQGWHTIKTTIPHKTTE